MSAEARVLRSPELLEAILLSVDIRTLLVSVQRVNQFWRDVVTTSPNLQQALFLQPQVPKTGNVLPGERTLNPLLKETFKPWFHPPSSLSRFHSHGREVLYSLPLAQPQRNKAFTRAEASWRRMLIHQPPMHDFGFVEEVRNEAGSMYLRSHVSVKDWVASTSNRHRGRDSPSPPPEEQGDGLRMGQLYDFTLQVLREDETVGAMRFRTFWCRLPLTLAGCNSNKMRGILNFGFDPQIFGYDYQLLLFVEAETSEPLLLRHVSMPASKAKPKLRCEDHTEIRFAREGFHHFTLP